MKRMRHTLNKDKSSQGTMPGERRYLAFGKDFATKRKESKHWASEDKRHKEQSFSAGHRCKK